MPRPPNCRRIAAPPTVSFFKPAGIPTRQLEMVTLTLDEYEAIRLADREGLYQEEAAERMGVSRATFGRIVDVAHRKIAEAITDGKALRIEGGQVHAMQAGPFRCRRCGMHVEGDECPKHGGTRGAGPEGSEGGRRPG